MYEAQGTIKVIDDIQTFGSGFTKREFVITVESKYPQDIKFELVKDKCDWLDKFAVGQQVTVNFDIRGNEYNGKYYVNLSAWKIQAGAGGGNAPQAQNAAPSNTPANDMPNFSNQGGEPSIDDLRGDDIPF